jgi:hypothetical protein
VLHTSVTGQIPGTHVPRSERPVHGSVGTTQAHDCRKIGKVMMLDMLNAWQTRPSKQSPPHCGKPPSLHRSVASGTHTQARRSRSHSPLNPHRSPAGQDPLQVVSNGSSDPQVNGEVVVVVVGLTVVELVDDEVVDVVVVVVDVVVVVGDTQPPDPHASQQLGTEPTHALPPFGARQASAVRFVAHRVTPRRFVRQHVTAPGRPHVERAAQRRTSRRQAAGRSPAATRASAIVVAHRTWDL